MVLVKLTPNTTINPFHISMITRFGDKTKIKLHGIDVLVVDKPYEAVLKLIEDATGKKVV